MSIKGKKPTVRLIKLLKSKWPKLHKMAIGRNVNGIWVQAAVTALLDQNGVKVVDVECDCDCAEYAAREGDERHRHDVDVLVEIGERKVPIQIGVYRGELMHNPGNVVHKYGAVDDKSVNKIDAEHIRKKIRQTPPGGITLIHTNIRVSPSDDWWYNGINGKCVVLWRTDWYSEYHGMGMPAHSSDYSAMKRTPCLVYHGTGGPTDAAEELCSVLGCEQVGLQAVKPRRSQNTEHEKHLPFYPKTADGLAATVRKNTKKWTVNPDDVIGALYYPAYASAYFGALQVTDDDIHADGLVPILRHVVGRHMDSVDESAVDEAEWRGSVLNALRMLEGLAKADTKVDSDVLVEICHILQDIASKRYDGYVCKTLSLTESERRLHLAALFCLTYVVCKLREKTPAEVRETLTAAARTGGQEGIEHRVVLGYALPGLRWAIPDWYAENESLLFGEHAPDGLNSVLLRVCSHVDFPDKQIMEKYHALVLKALDEEIRCARRRGSDVGDQLVIGGLMKYFVIHTLRGSRGYTVEDSVRDLARLGPDAVSAAGRECVFQIKDEKLVDRGVQFWEAVLDSSPKPEALYGFGLWMLAESVDRDTWERLMLRTCNITSDLAEPIAVIDRASSDGNPTESGIRIIKLMLRTNRHLFADLAMRYIIGRMQKNGVSIDTS